MKYFMNVETGSVDTYDGWWYENEDGVKVNAVELGEVVEVVKNEDGDWVEGEAEEKIENRKPDAWKLYDGRGNCIGTYATMEEADFYRGLHNTILPYWND